MQENTQQLDRASAIPSTKSESSIADQIDMRDFSCAKRSATGEQTGLNSIGGKNGLTEKAGLNSLEITGLPKCPSEPGLSSQRNSAPNGTDTVGERATSSAGKVESDGEVNAKKMDAAGVREEMDRTREKYMAYVKESLSELGQALQESFSRIPLNKDGVGYNDGHIRFLMNHSGPKAAQAMRMFIEATRTKLFYSN